MSNVKIRKFYISDIQHQVGASPIWPVSACYKLGDYGYYSKKTGHFSVRGNIFDDLGISREGVIVPSPNPPVILYKIFNSSNTSRNEYQTEVTASAQGGKLELAFESDKAYLFHMFRAEVSYLKLNDTVRSKLGDATKNDKWNHRYRIIEMIYECPDVRFAYSLSKNSTIILSGNADLGQSPAKATINYKMQNSTNVDGSLWIENAKSTPFVMFASFKRRELRFHDVKELVSNDWYLESDNTSSFDDDSDLA